ncbi:MAG: type IV pilin protein [Thalassolituus sp.]
MKKIKGFTLLELLIALIVVGIISSIAYPSYQDSVREAKRSDAIAIMQKMLASEEKYFIDNRVYADDLKDLGLNASTYSTDYYDISASQCTNPADLSLCVELTALGTGDQEKDGKIIMNTIGRSVHIDADGVETQL